MARSLGLGVLPWSPLAGGVLSGKYRRKDLEDSEPGSVQGSRKNVAASMGMLSERSLAIADAVKSVAKDLGKSPSQVALRWLLQKPGVTAPIIGARKLEHLEDNLGCLDFEIGEEQMKQLDEASAIELGFPHDFLNSDMVRYVLDGGVKVERRD